MRLCRRRFWKGEYTADKIAAYQTLYECLTTVAKLMAPMAPFFADWLYKNLNGTTGQDDHVSVHLALLDEPNIDAIDKELEQRMDYAQRISSLVLSLRKKERLRVRQPLQKVLLPILDNSFKDQVEKVKDLVLSEVNIKEIEYLEDTAGFIKKKIKPNFKTLGRKLGKDMKSAAQLINSLGQEDIDQIEKTGVYALTIGDAHYDLTTEDFEISADDIPGWQVASDREITVALDITLTDELKKEGIARELINRIQNIRKSSDFEVTDRINVVMTATDEISQSLESYSDYIATEVLADNISLQNDLKGEPIDIVDGLSVAIAVTKI